MSATPASMRSDLGMRAIMAIPPLAVLVAIDITGGLVWALVVLGVGFICLQELCRMMSLSPLARLTGPLVLAALIMVAQFGGQEEVLLSLLGAVFLLSLALIRESVPTVRLLLGVYWIGFCLACAVLLRGLPHGALLIADVLAGAFVSDTAAYLGGRAYGKHHPVPTISPNKSTEGFVTGALAAVVTIWLLGLSQDWISGLQALLLGIGIAVVAPLGDLFESWVKRYFQVKDSGSLLGPHGGFLDRIDAALFAVVGGYVICSTFFG